ncbi:hypothetical protein M885DRAFT_512663 [Pelagophyceae sp. CCMP2097]|nr:hypothetical protein M885DRAFT_512663 [Pelagophyceae sp. CCMP2097]
MLLSLADEAPPPETTRCAYFFMQLLARLPLAHSTFWLVFVVWAAKRGGENKQDVLKVVIECWLLYSFSKYIITGQSALYGLWQLKKNTARDVEDWASSCAAHQRAASASKAGEVEEGCADKLAYEDVLHVVAIPSYKEDISTLRRTLGTVAAQRDAKAAIVVVLAMEARDPRALETATLLAQEFAPQLHAVYITLHALRDGEVGGKSSNENWAVRCAKRELVNECGVSSHRVVVTVCDADTYFHRSHFAALAHAYVTCPPKERNRRFWQCATQFYPNCDDVPLLCSVRYALLSIGFLGQLANPLHYKLPFAVYALALDLVVEAKYWDAAVIPEDWHMFLRCFYATGGQARVQPIFLPVGCECVTDRTASATVAACYAQACRWQWGAIDLGFIAVHTRDVAPWKQLAVLLAASEHHLLYPLMWIVLAAAPWLVDGWAEGWRFRLWACFYVTNWACLNLIDTLYRNLLSRKAADGAGGQHAADLAKPRIARVLAFAFFPIADCLLFVLPSLHAHARMAISTSFNYVVAPKVPSLRSLALLKEAEGGERISLAGRSPDGAPATYSAVPTR